MKTTLVAVLLVFACNTFLALNHEAFGTHHLATFKKETIG